MTHDPNHPPRYPPGTVRALLQTEHVSEATRATLQPRLERPTNSAPVFLTPETFAILRAATSRLLALDEQERLDTVVLALDEELATGAGDGWRYAEMPPDGDTMRRGLVGIEETARLRFNQSFHLLDAQHQDDVLAAVQTSGAEGTSWEHVPGPRFFEELLATLSVIFYADPIAQEEIGYVGMADRPGWETIRLNDLATREPRPLLPNQK